MKLPFKTSGYVDPFTTSTFLFTVLYGESIAVKPLFKLILGISIVPILRAVVTPNACIPYDSSPLMVIVAPVSFFKDAVSVSEVAEEFPYKPTPP